MGMWPSMPNKTSANGFMLTSPSGVCRADVLIAAARCARVWTALEVLVLRWLDSMKRTSSMIENLAASLASSALRHNRVARWVMFEVLRKCGFWLTEWEVSCDTEWVRKQLTFAKWARSWTLSAQDCFFTSFSTRACLWIVCVSVTHVAKGN